MRAFVTGGAGFIGRHLVDLLLEQGHQVTVLAAPGEPTDHLPASVSVVAADLNDADALSRSIPGCDVLYHLAARTDLDGASIDDYTTNTIGTQNLLDAVADQPLERFVFYSSMLAAGMPRDDKPVDETYDRPPTTAYGQSKLDAERRVEASGLPWTVIRPTFVYGPCERSTIFALFKAINARRFALIGRPVPQSYVYVKNLVSATVDASISPGGENQVFLISDARPYSLHEFAAAAANELGRPLWPLRLPRAVAMAAAYPLSWLAGATGISVPLFPSRVRTMTRPYVYSIAKARSFFGYAPADHLPKFMHETIAEARASDAL